MNYIKILLLILISTTYGCARVEIVDTGSHADYVLAPTNADDVFIYRSQRPEWSYKEIGLISVNGIDDINVIYRSIRDKSSLKGASGVIDFDLESDEITTTSTSTSCMPQGGCSTTTSTTTTIVYAASGTLIIKNRL